MRQQAAQSAALALLRSLLAQKHRPTADHCSRVMWYAGRTAGVLNLSERAIDVVCHASLVHDVGKMRIPDRILNHPRRLDESSMDAVRGHAVLGEQILQRFPGRHMREIALLVGAHHERFDGSGYPRRLRGCNIPLGARIIAVCDAFDAMTVGRCYRAPWSYARAVEERVACAGTQFDPAVVEAFVTIGDERLFRMSS